MEHPGLDINQIKEELNLEGIQEKIMQLRNRMTFAYQTNNQAMMTQLEMMLEIYTRAQMEVLNDMFSSNGDGPDLDDKIDVS